MNKNNYVPTTWANSGSEKFISDNALNALDSGAGNRPIGNGGGGIAVGDTFTLINVDYVTQLMPKRGISNNDFSAMSDEDKQANGVTRSWFTMNTNNGPLSFSALLGHKDMYTSEFWDKESDENKGNTIDVADDFDVTTIFSPSARTPAAFIKNGCDELLGKTVKCVGVKTFTQNGFEVKARAFMVL